MADRRKESPVEWWRWRRQIGPSLDAVCLAGNGGYIDFLSDPRLRKRGLRAFRQALIPDDPAPPAAPRRKSPPPACWTIARPPRTGCASP